MHIAMLHCLNILKSAEVTGLMPEKQASLTGAAEARETMVVGARSHIFISFRMSASSGRSGFT